MIPATSFELSNGTGYDVFQFYCEYFHVSNPHTEGKLSITASSTFQIGELERETVDTLISTPGEGRWVSESIENSSITIDFFKNKLNLVGYTFSTSNGYRFIKSWDIYGIYHNKMYLLDSRRDSPLCTESNSANRCITNSEKSFIVKNPGCFSKFHIVHIGLDSELTHYFSLSGIKFYGSLNPIFQCPTFLEKHSNIYSTYYLSFVLFFISS